jgi:hypothetical protein
MTRTAKLAMVRFGHGRGPELRILICCSQYFRRALTRITAFWAIDHRNPQMEFNAPRLPASCLESEIQPDAVIERQEETHLVFRENLVEPQPGQSKYAGRTQNTFKVGDRVCLAPKHLGTTRPSKMLEYKHTGPYAVSRIMNQNTYKLDWPNIAHNHNIFHMSLTDRYSPPIAEQHASHCPRRIVGQVGD